MCPLIDLNCMCTSPKIQCLQMHVRWGWGWEKHCREKRTHVQILERNYLTMQSLLSSSLNTSKWQNMCMCKLGIVKDECTFNSLFFLKSKLHNKLTTLTLLSTCLHNISTWGRPFLIKLPFFIGRVGECKQRQGVTWLFGPNLNLLHHPSSCNFL